MRSTRRLTETEIEKGFTLVELLVSMGILVLLIVLIVGLFNGANLVISANSERREADNAARLVLDRMAGDIAVMTKRPDVNYIFFKNGASATPGANDAMFFYGEGPAAASGTASFNSVALLGYRVNTANPYFSGVPVLERLGCNLNWDGNAGTGTAGGMVFLTYTGTTPNPSSTLSGNWASIIGSAPYSSGSNYNFYQVLNSDVFRMEICFLVKSGTYTLTGASGVATGVTGTTGFTNTPTGMQGGQTFITGNYLNDGNVYGLPPDLAAICGHDCRSRRRQRQEDTRRENRQPCGHARRLTPCFHRCARGYSAKPATPRAGLAKHPQLGGACDHAGHPPAGARPGPCLPADHLFGQKLGAIDDC